MLTLTGCGSGSDDGTTDTQPGTDASDTTLGSTDQTDSGNSSTPSQSDDPGNEIVVEGGTATFTIDGETYEFDSFLCAFGHEATGNDNIGFAAVGEGSGSDGAPVQIAVELHDEGIRTGWRIVYLLAERGPDDFEIVWALNDTEPLQSEGSEGRAVLEQDGDDLSIEGGEYDWLENQEETGISAQGSLQGVCSPDSLR